jgi:hypothetical protein
MEVLDIFSISALAEGATIMQMAFSVHAHGVYWCSQFPCYAGEEGSLCGKGAALEQKHCEAAVFHF